MKKSTLLIVACMVVFAPFAQVKISADSSNPDGSAGLEVDFDNKGFLPPRMSTEQRDAIENPSTGLQIFNTTTNCINYRVGLEWYELCGTPPAGTIATLDCEGAMHSGNLIEGIAASDVSSLVTYTGGNGGPHTGQTVTSTGVTGLTATLSAGSFISGSNTLSFSITGTPSAPGTASFAINIGGQACTLTRMVTSPPFTCGSSTVTFTYKSASVTYGTVAGANSKCWLDRNLGAAQVAANSTDVNAYGDMFQWGRGDDGHQNRTSAITSGACDAVNSDTPPHSNFIKCNSAPKDWRNPKNDNLWQGVNGINNPCPVGWRIPTEDELNAERISWSSNNSAGAFASPLKLTLTGFRDENSGDIYSIGTTGYYWSSTFISTSARALSIGSSSASAFTDNRAIGFAVRCIKN